MRPLPTASPRPASAGPAASAEQVLELREPGVSNQRRNVCTTQRAYPWLLGLSTLMAATFCILYISKPVIVTESPVDNAGETAKETSPPAVDGSDAPALADTPMISPDALPGDGASRPRPASPRALAENPMGAFEETNLRIQHVLSARGPSDQDLGRVVLDVPVLYRSGNVRWTQEDVNRARSLLVRLDEYQGKARALRDEAVGIIADWDQLIVASVPEPVLRADSPTLPENQGPGTAGEGPMNTTDAIEIENP